MKYLFQRIDSYLPKWLSFYWYKYLWSSTSFENFICKIKGHPNGVIWYNPNGLEPNYSCKDCGEEIW